MASAQVVETSVTNNSPSSQDSDHPDDLFQSRYVTPGFKPFSYSLYESYRGLDLLLLVDDNSSRNPEFKQSITESSRHSTKSNHRVHYIWESLSIERWLDLLSFSVVKSGHTARKNCNLCYLIELVQYSVNLSQSQNIISCVSALTFVQNNHNFKFTIFSLHLL